MHTSNNTSSYRSSTLSRHILSRKSYYLQWMLMFTLLFLLLFTASPAFAQGGKEETSPDYTDPDQLQTLIEEQKEPHMLIDVRTPGEFSSGHIPTAVIITVDLIASNPPDAEKDQLIIVYCRSGNRSAAAAGILEDLGFTQVYDFGGINRWLHDLER